MLRQQLFDELLTRRPLLRLSSSSWTKDWLLSLGSNLREWRRLLCLCFCYFVGSRTHAFSWTCFCVGCPLIERGAAFFGNVWFSFGTEVLIWLMSALPRSSKKVSLFPLRSRQQQKAVGEIFPRLSLLSVSWVKKSFSLYERRRTEYTECNTRAPEESLLLTTLCSLHTTHKEGKGKRLRQAASSHIFLTSHG